MKQAKLIPDARPRAKAKEHSVKSLNYFRALTGRSQKSEKHPCAGNREWWEAQPMPRDHAPTEAQRACQKRWQELCARYMAAGMKPYPARDKARDELQAAGEWCLGS